MEVNLSSRLPIDPPQEENVTKPIATQSAQAKPIDSIASQSQSKSAEAKTPDLLESTFEVNDLPIHEHVTRENDMESLDVGNFQTVDDPVRRRQLIRRIADYKSRFGEFLEDILPKDIDLSTQSVSDLEIIFEDCLHIVEHRSAAQMARTIFIAGTSVLEVSSDVVGLKLKGLTTHVSKNPALSQCLDEISLKYDPIATDPIARLGLIMAQTCLAIDQANRQGLIQQNPHGQAPTTPGLGRPDKKREELLRNIS